MNAKSKLPAGRLPIAGLMVLALAAIGGAVWGAGAFEQSRQSRASSGDLCASCHEAQHVQGVHAPLACGTCHAEAVQRAVQLSWSSWGIGTPAEHGKTAACTACHGEQGSGPLRSEGHVQHGAEQASCLDCHRDAHEVTTEVQCARCHEDLQTHGPAQEAPCATCHKFASAAAETPSVSFHTADGSGRVDASRVHGSMDCRRCHNPHDDERTTVQCQDCHRGRFEEELAQAPPFHQECSGCHEVHASREQLAVDCLGCHVYPKGKHHWGAKPEGTSLEEQKATRAHITHGGQCGTCHTPHTWRADDARCATCHENQAQTLAVHGGADHQRCQSCHRPHEPRPTAAVCSSCHKAQHRDQTRAPEEHRDCLSCHDAHGARPQPAQRCSSCHQAEARPTATHQGPCVSCHLPHGSAMTPASDCASCHRDVHPKVRAHKPCSSCHQPHQPATQATTVCATCHAPIVAAGARWGASKAQKGVNPHGAAQQCLACHEPHAEQSTQACQRCHQAQSTPQHMGRTPGHSQCIDCHAPHQAKPAGAASWWNRCARCHQAEAQAIKGLVGTHGQCSACHRPPGPPLPRCSTCHASIASQLGHREHAQSECASCHTNHGTPRVQKKQCLGCHENMSQHFADAPRCQSCHLFGK